MISLDILIDDDRWHNVPGTDQNALFPLATSVLGDVWPDHGDVDISVLLTDDGRIQILNRDYRGKDSPTNVLSFGVLESGTRPPRVDKNALHPYVLGDIVMSYDTIIEQAKSAQKPIENHIAHMMVHGLLHLLGHDHENDDDATLMESLETRILAGKGISNPYEPLTPQKPEMDCADVF